MIRYKPVPLPPPMKIDSALHHLLMFKQLPVCLPLKNSIIKKLITNLKILKR